MSFDLCDSGCHGDPPNDDKKMKKGYDNDGSISKVQSYPSHSAADFKSKVQKAFGHILSSKIQDAICQYFDARCLALSSEHSISVQCFVLSVLKLLAPNVKVDTSILCADCNVKSFVPHSQQCAPSHVPEENSPKFDLELKLGCKPSSRSENVDCFANAENVSALIKDDTRKVSFKDINQSVPQGCAISSQRNVIKFSQASASGHPKRIRGVNYAPDTFSPTPAHASCSQHLGNNPFPGHPNSCSKSSRHAENVIHLDDETYVDISGSKLLSTPKISGNVLTSGNPVISPEVVFVSENKFADRLNKLCKKSEKMYNEDLFSLKQSYRRASRGIDEEDGTDFGVVNDDISIVEEQYESRNYGGNSASIHTKFNQGSRFYVSKYEILFYLAVCNFSKSEAYYDAYAVDIGGVHVKFGSLGQSLRLGSQVGSFVVNVCCRKFFLDERPTVSRKHYFFSSVGDVLMRDTMDFSYVKKCFDGAGSVVPLRAVKMLLFPICYDRHWFLFVVDLKNKFFFFLDSLYCKDDEYQLSARKKLVLRFILAWDTIVAVDMKFREFQIAYPHVPKQDNLVDCGVFVIKFMELWRFNAHLTQEFSQVDIPNLRVRIVCKLLLSEHNKVDVRFVSNALRMLWKKDIGLLQTPSDDSQHIL